MPMRLEHTGPHVSIVAQQTYSTSQRALPPGSAGSRNVFGMGGPTSVRRDDVLELPNRMVLSCAMPFC